MSRICVITLDPSLVGGVQTHLAAFLRYAETRGHVCDVYYPHEGSTTPRRVNGITATGVVQRVVPIRVTAKSPHFWRAAEFARRCRLDGAYDAHLLIGSALDLALPFVRDRRPFAAWVAGAAAAEMAANPRLRLRHYLLYNPVCDHFTRRQEVRAARHAESVLAVSTYAAATVRQHLQIPADRVTVLPVPVDTSVFRPGEPVHRPRRYVLSVGRLERRKGFPELLRAWQTVVQRFPDLELRIVGHGKERLVLERLAAQLGIRDRVKFLGGVPTSELIEQYRGASLFVLASRQEGLGIVFLEALACGLPVVATDCGGASDPIVDGRTGVLVSQGDWSGFAQAMLRLLGDSRLADRLGRAGREKAVAEYSTEAVFRTLDRLYAAEFRMAGTR